MFKYFPRVPGNLHSIIFDEAAGARCVVRTDCSAIHYSFAQFCSKYGKMDCIVCPTRLCFVTKACKSTDCFSCDWSLSSSNSSHSLPLFKRYDGSCRAPKAAFEWYLSVWSRILLWCIKHLNIGKTKDFLSQALTIWERFPSLVTGNICLKALRHSTATCQILAPSREDLSMFCQQLLNCDDGS